MDIGLPRQQHPHEYRVALTPSGVKALVQDGHRVWVETGAGCGAGHGDGDYTAAGASIAFSRMEALARPEMLLCVSPPAPADLESLRRGQVVIAFWHLPAARREDLRVLLERGVSAVG